MSELVSYALDGDVAVITLDDGKANAISHQMAGDVHDALGRARTEAGAVAIVGRPGRFSAGFDLATMTSGTDNARELLRVGAELALEIYDFPRPVVIGATGHALAMGAILLFASDLRIGADGDFKIGLNEVAIGMPVPRFAVELGRDRLSPRAFSQAIGLARIHSPQEAAEAGFLDEVVAADQVVPAAVEAAARLGSTLRRTAFELTRTAARGDKLAQLRHGLAADVAEFVVELPSD